MSWTGRPQRVQAMARDTAAEPAVDASLQVTRREFVALSLCAGAMAHLPIAAEAAPGRPVTLSLSGDRSGRAMSIRVGQGRAALRVRTTCTS